MSFNEWLNNIQAHIDRGDRHYLSGSHNLHSLYLAQTDPVMAGFYRRCNECYIDGVPVRLAAAAAGIATRAEQRFSLMDQFPQLLERAARCGWRVVYIGSRQEVVDKARARLSREFPGLRIVLHHGYFAEDGILIETINGLRPDLLLVGMGMPRQEQWLLSHLDQLDVGVATHAGATLDFFAGYQAKPPAWMSKVGFAWLYRLAHDPRRLWRRYLLEPWALVLPTLRLWRAG
jgi:N-acetylglucosaminyldiphosphoundecaprenol N-acetyl-beta-D-mannosaminyltransferase